MKKINHIDKLFSEGLNPEKDPIPFNKADWDLLEQRLNARERRKQVVFWTKTLSGIAAVILLVFSWWLINPVKQKSPVQQTAIQKDTPLSPDSSSINKPVESKDPSGLVFNNIGKQFISKETLKEDLDRVEISYLDTGFKPRISIPDSMPSIENRIAVKALDSINTQQTAILSPKSEKPVVSGLEPRKVVLSILAAPAINGVNNFNNVKVGSDIGVLLTVGLTKRLSVSTGAIYAKKLYETGFDNYNPSGDTWFKYNPEEVYADCRVLDIPLNLNYELINKGKHIVSLGTGLSSYLMLKEDYHFVYGKSNSTGPQDVHLVNENKHLFSVINLEASYERRLNSKIGISLQPYMKIPISDIGFARVKLQSVGMAVNIKMNLGKNK